MEHVYLNEKCLSDTLNWNGNYIIYIESNFAHTPDKKYTISTSNTACNYVLLL